MKEVLKVIITILIIALAIQKATQPAQTYVKPNISNLLTTIENIELWEIPNEIKVPEIPMDNIFKFLNPIITVINGLIGRVINFINIIMQVFQFIYIIIEWFARGAYNY